MYYDGILTAWHWCEFSLPMGLVNWFREAWGCVPPPPSIATGAARAEGAMGQVATYPTDLQEKISAF